MCDGLDVLAGRRGSDRREVEVEKRISPLRRQKAPPSVEMTDLG